MATSSSARSAGSPATPRRACSKGTRALARLRFVEDTGSTNADLLASPDAVEGEWLVAARQSAGRGRQGRKWESASGNFFGSTLVMLRAGDPSPATLSLAAGLALLEALEVAAPGEDYRLKWPNDLLLGTGKLAGILLERSGERVVVGFGVNLAEAPEIEGRETASLGGRIVPQAFAPLLAASFARLLGAWRTADAEAFARAWEQRALPRGTPLSVHEEGGQRFGGTFDGIDADGAMRLRLADGTTATVRAGDTFLG